MKTLYRFFLFVIVGLANASAQGNLPACQGGDVSRCSNCVGSNTFASGNKYVGEHKDGKPNGQGTYTFANGNIYVGEFKDGKRNGQFTVTFARGDKYVGEYKDDMQNGQGTYTFANGNKYVGEYKDGKRSGQGTFTFANGNKHVGEYKDDKRNGQGTVTFADNGDKYVGEFKDDKFNGQGTFTFANGNKYVGEFKDDKRNGQGTLILAIGNKHVGEFKDDKRNGQITTTFASGDKYVGEYKDDMQNGQGTYTFANGNKYVGEYKDGKRSGQGTQYAANGSVINQGIWADGNFVRTAPVEQATVTNQAVAVASSNWIGDPKTGCKVVNSQPLPNETIEFIGNCSNGFANGKGVVTWYKDGNFNQRTEAIYINGVRNGFGYTEYQSGDKYVGDFKDNKQHGQGTYTHMRSGNKYVGEHKNDKRNGQGTLYSSNGSVINQGIWVDGNFVRTAPVQQAAAPNNEIEKLRLEAEESKRLLAQAEDQRRIQTQLAEMRLGELEEQLKLAKQQNQVAPPTAMTTMANRKALVIGNDSYKSVSKLLNAREDAKAIASSLEGVGYKVTLKLDLNEKELKAALRTFSNQVQGGDEVLFFFAGHGLQLGSTNYLLPIDIGAESEAQVRDEAIQLQRVLDDMTEKKAKFTLAMIDACRDNPFKTIGRAIGGRGLAPTTAATGQMVVFSAGTGQQALDRLGNSDKNKNGVFTRTFLKEMQKPGVSIDRIVKNVRNEVAELAKTVGHEQVPAIYDQVLGDFYFKK
jgi:hypothetical protein